MSDQPPYPPPGGPPNDSGAGDRPRPDEHAGPPEPPTQAAWPPYGSSAAGSYGQVPYPGGAPNPSYPPPAFGQPFQQNHSGATTSMTLGIVSIVAAVLGTCLCVLLGAAGAVIGPFGIWQGVRARNEIRADPGRYSNEGQATAGLVCGIIGTALGLVVLLAAIALLVIYGIALTEATTY